MQNIFIDILPPWVETGLQPAFYDLESGTVLQQTARMYAKVRELTEAFNTFSENVTNEITTFEQNTNDEIERFEGVINDTVEEYIGKFNDLHDYVEDYFENLDVQEEINNKLDDMVEDGVLQEIITTYIQSNVAWTFDNVAEMKTATNLIAGSYARTLGFNSIGDGGSAIYHITSTGTANEMDKIEVYNNLIANLVAENNMTFEQFGAYGDGVHDDSSVINYVLGTLDYTIKPLAKTYAVGTQIDINPYKGVDFNNACLKALTADMVVVNYYQASVDNTWQDRQTGIYNLSIDCNNTASKGLRVHVWQKDFTNINIYNVHNIGIHFDGGYENHFDKIRILSNENNTGTTGWKVEAGDSTFDNITGIDLGIFWDDYGRFNEIGYAHAWILHPTLSSGSKMFNLTSLNTKLTINYAYVDTYHYGFYYALDSAMPNALLYVNTIWFIVNENCFDFTGSDRPTVFGYYGNYTVSNVRIKNVHVESISAAKNSVMFENRNALESAPAFTGFIEDRYIGANTTGLYNLASDYAMPGIDSSKFTTVHANRVVQTGRVVTFEFTGELPSTAPKANVIGTIPQWLTAYGQAINTCCFLSSNQWGSVANPDNNCYLYIGTNGQIQIRIPDNTDVATYKYLKIRLVYLRQN